LNALEFDVGIKAVDFFLDDLASVFLDLKSIGCGFFRSIIGTPCFLGSEGGSV
jgi:formate dehydrogenase maturation protein FdhE